MALYANENGTLQQLSDKSSGSNPYGQLEIVYYRDFLSNPSTAAEKGYHDVYTNKAIKDYKFILITKGETPNSYVYTTNPNWHRIDLWMECCNRYHAPSYDVKFDPSAQTTRSIYIRCKGTRNANTESAVAAAFNNNILEIEFYQPEYTEGHLGVFMI